MSRRSSLRAGVRTTYCLVLAWWVACISHFRTLLKQRSRYSSLHTQHVHCLELNMALADMSPTSLQRVFLRPCTTGGYANSSTQSLRSSSVSQLLYFFSGYVSNQPISTSFMEHWQWSYCFPPSICSSSYSSVTQSASSGTSIGE